MTIVSRHPIDDDALLRLGAEHENLFIEREADGSLTVTPPPSFRNAVAAAEAAHQLRAWGGDRGLVAGADGGFRMPDASVRIPDASWISLERWHAQTAEQQANIAHVVPEICIEIVSPSERRGRQREKARRYVAQGAVYAVAIDPRTRRADEFGTPPDGLRLDFERII